MRYFLSRVHLLDENISSDKKRKRCCMTSRKPNGYNLLHLVENSKSGELLLPDFQRSFIWPLSQVEEILVSIMKDYFMGNFLVLETSGNQNPFSVRLIEGVEEANPEAHARLVAASGPENIRLLLDGQQRLTSVFYALYQPAIPLGDASNPYNFFVNLESLLEGDFENAVEGISIRNAKRMSEANAKAGQGAWLPFNLLKRHRDFYSWLSDEKHSFLSTEQQKNSVVEYVEHFFSYEVPVITLTGNQPPDSVVETFERINRLGTSLSTFDLLVAKLYPKNVRLRDLWASSYKDNISTFDFMGSYQAGRENVLKIVSLKQTGQCKKTDLLQIRHQRFDASWKQAVTDTARAVSRLRKLYGSFESRWIPFRSMVVPLATLLFSISRRKRASSLYDKLDCWYWSAVFSERYQRSGDTFSARDFGEIRDWFENDLKVPEWIKNFAFDETDLDEALGQRSGVYRSVMSLMAATGAIDPITGQKVDLDDCEADHIFPESVFANHPKVQSITNLTLISKETNREKRAKKPSEYIPFFLKKLGSDEKKLKSVLETHFIDETAYNCMLSDDLDGFLEARKNSIAEAIRKQCCVPSVS